MTTHGVASAVQAALQRISPSCSSEQRLHVALALYMLLQEKGVDLWRSWSLLWDKPDIAVAAAMWRLARASWTIGLLQLLGAADDSLLKASVVRMQKADDFPVEADRLEALQVQILAQLAIGKAQRRDKS